MRTAGALPDENQPDIVSALERIGASVHVTSRAGRGFPDLVVGWRGRTYLLEVKNPAKPKGDQRLTPAQQKWHREWRGHVVVVRTPREALEVLGLRAADGGAR